MLQDLRQDIYTIGNSVSGSHGCYYNSEPQDSTFPYITYFLVTDTITRQVTNGGAYHDYIVQFSLFDRRTLENGNVISCVTLDKTTEELMSKFEAGTISVPGYRLVDKRIQFVRPSTIVDEIYWNSIIQYLLMFEKN